MAGKNSNDGKCVQKILGKPDLDDVFTSQTFPRGASSTGESGRGSGKETERKGDFDQKRKDERGGGVYGLRIPAGLRAHKPILKIDD